MGAAPDIDAPLAEVHAGSALLGYGASTLLALCAFSLFYTANLYQYFKRLGLKNPPTYPFVGNLVQMLFTDRMATEQEWRRKYGKLYGVFRGMRPAFVVADAEVLRQVCIKDFDVFPNHDKDRMLNDYQKNFIIFMQDGHWKRMRALQSPTFTSGKIRRMHRLLDRCADDLNQCFGEQLERDGRRLDKAVVNLKEIYSLYTMDAIASAAFQVKLQRKGSSNIKTAATRDDFIAEAYKLFELNLPRLFISTTLPKRLLYAINYHILPNRSLHGIAKRARHLVEQRRKSGKKHDDYLQLLVDARLGTGMELGEMDEKENHHAGLSANSLESDQNKLIKDIGGAEPDRANGAGSPSATKMTMADDEVVASAMFLLMVGLETTATLLTNCSYALAFHQPIQERLYETVKEMGQKDPETGEYTFDYDAITSCQYLDAVVSETLRALSPVLMLDRVATRDYHIEKYNVTVKKGQKLWLAYHAIMNDPDYWSEPHKFDPERFMPENKHKIVPGSYCPFGLGPRHCLGMRFSLTETKLALAKVLMKFRFQPAPNTSYPPTSARNLGLNTPKVPLVELVRK